MLESTASRWRALGRENCLSQEITLHSRDLIISDVRLMAAIGDHPDPRYPAPEKEPAFAAFANYLHLGKKQMNASAPVLFGIAITAVAEWYQRAFNQPSFEQLMDAMATLARLTPSTLAAGSPIEFTIAASGGSWCCLRCQEPISKGEFMEVRQFVSSEDDYADDGD